jgi:hypothetical protein
MSKNDPWQHVVKALQNIKGLDIDPIDPRWVLCYTDGIRNIAMDHGHSNLDDVLQVFEDFCKGAGFVFDHFAIVDEDGIPIHGLNSLAKLEANNDEDKTG